MPDQDALIARAHAGRRVAEFLTDPEVNTAYREAVANLEARILAFDPKESANFTIARSMLLGIQELWATLGGIVVRGKEAESELDGKETPSGGPGRIL